MTPADSSAVPTLDEWLALSPAALAAIVRPRRPAVMLAIDGTRRHYLLAHPEQHGQLTDFAAYSAYSAAAYARVYGLLFGLGIETIMTSFLYPPNFIRGGTYLPQALAASQALLMTGPLADLYAQWQVRARIYGDYDFAPAAAPVRGAIHEAAQALAAATPTGDRLLLIGYSAGSFVDEIIVRSATLQATLGRVPTTAELRAACYPDGPEALNIYIAAGCLRVALALPPLLDEGATDIYNLAHLPLDLQEETMRRILYDHLFRRWAGGGDFQDYAPDDLAALRTYYAAHRNCLVGLGQLAAGAFWYADHPHPPDVGPAGRS